jgi:L-alanine-DL-glutamate epimerase-like enolase superfamily enzyme
MKVVGGEVIPYALPFIQPYVTARGTLTMREMVLLRIRSDEGATGLGEAVPLALRGGASLEDVTSELRAWLAAPESGDDGLSSPSRSAIATALLDVQGREAEVPVWSLLGGDDGQPVRCNATLSIADPALVADEALEWAEEGFGSFKAKVGAGEDVEQVAQVRSAVGPEPQLRVDANGAWTPEAAEQSLRAMVDHDLELAEQPCATLSELAELRGRIDLPIAGDESVADAAEARLAAESGACDLATAKLSKVGGPREALAVAEELPIYLSSALDGPVGIAAAAHTAQALSGAGDAGVAHGLATQRLFAETIASSECGLRDGYLHLPEGPGLGVEIDDAALERHRL